MKIKSLELRGFRAFPNRQLFDLDADTIVVMGPNGQGKTSLFDGILWALTGKIVRLGDKDEDLISKYSASGSASASLVLQNQEGVNLSIFRTTDGTEQKLRFSTNRQVFEGSSAKARLLEQLWPDALLTSESENTLSQAITRSTYLQQDLVRQFVDSDTEQERFTALSELVGIGRVTELQLQLDRQKTAWTRATNNLDSEAQPIRQRRANIESQLQRLARSATFNSESLSSDWDVWWRECKRLGVEPDSSVGPISEEAQMLLDLTLKELAAIKRNRDRQLELALALRSDLQGSGNAPPLDPSNLLNELQFRKQRTQSLRKQLEDARNQASEERRTQVEAHERIEELRTLARLALRHLEEQCPVCAQTYDRGQTKRRLEALIGAPSRDPQRESVDQVSRLAAELQAAEKNETETISALQRIEQEIRDTELRLTDRNRRLEELGIESSGSPLESLETLIARLSTEIVAFNQVIARGEKLTLEIAQASELSRRSELESELVASTRQCEQLDAELKARTETGDLAGRVLESLREATSDIVQERLQQIEPLLQRIYARVDPHPAFRIVRFLTSMPRGRGHLSTTIYDPQTQITSDSPEKVLSSSQVNALAVTLFLTFNLGVSSIPLKTVMLDDPLQSLDDVNLLGLIDLLRRTRDQRQLIVSTHEKRFGELFMRKLRPVTDGQRTRVIELSAWSRQGPAVSQYDCQRDTASLRIVA